MSDYRVLIPLDGSRRAETPLAYLGALKQMGDLQVRLLSVVDETEEFGALRGREAEDREFNLLSTYLREVAADIEKHVGIAVECRVRRGHPAGNIEADAVDFKPDLLLISTHGRSGIDRWRLGSVADKVVRAAICNTLVIGPNAVEQTKWLEGDLTKPFGSILVPLDGSQLAEAALPVAASFAGAFGSDIHLVQAVAIPAMTAINEGAYMPDLLDLTVGGARDYLARLAGQLPKLKVHTKIVVGPPILELESYITTGIDLVVMTSHGRGGMLRTALGSVTDRLLGGPAPVLVVRPPDA
jgi:nucleotide-binding universal stress UspA family protein